MTEVSLTEKETIVMTAVGYYGNHQALYNGVQDCGWGSFPNEKALGGVLSSLIQKGYISECFTDNDELELTHITLTEAGRQTAINLANEEFGRANPYL